MSNLPVVEHQAGSSKRPKFEIPIDGVDYVALCPKIAVWLQAANVINEASAMQGGGLPVAAKVNDVFDMILQQALDPEVIAEFTRRLKDPRDDIDIDVMWIAAMEIMRAAEPWIKAKGKEMGIVIPQLMPDPDKTRQPSVKPKQRRR